VPQPVLIVVVAVVSMTVLSKVVCGPVQVQVQVVRVRVRVRVRGWVSKQVRARYPMPVVELCVSHRMRKLWRSGATLTTPRGRK